MIRHWLHPVDDPLDWPLPLLIAALGDVNEIRRIEAGEDDSTRRRVEAVARQHRERKNAIPIWL